MLSSSEYETNREEKKNSMLRSRQHTDSAGKRRHIDGRSQDFFHSFIFQFQGRSSFGVFGLSWGLGGTESDLETASSGFVKKDCRAVPSCV